MRGNHLFDETQLGGRDAPDEEDEEQRVVTWVWTGHLMAERDIMIGQCINSQRVLSMATRVPDPREKVHIFLLICAWQQLMLW